MISGELGAFLSRLHTSQDSSPSATFFEVSQRGSYIGRAVLRVRPQQGCNPASIAFW